VVLQLTSRGDTRQRLFFIAGLGHETQSHQLMDEVDVAFDHRINRNPASRVKIKTCDPLFPFPFPFP